MNFSAKYYDAESDGRTLWMRVKTVGISIEKQSGILAKSIGIALLYGQTK